MTEKLCKAIGDVPAKLVLDCPKDKIYLLPRKYVGLAAIDPGLALLAAATQGERLQCAVTTTKDKEGKNIAKFGLSDPTEEKVG